MQLRSGVAVAGMYASSYSSDWTPSLGTSICHGCDLKRQKKKKRAIVWVSLLFCIQAGSASDILFGEEH